MSSLIYLEATGQSFSPEKPLDNNYAKISRRVKKRIHSIDIIRGLAALSVLATHLGLPSRDGGILTSLVSLYHQFFLAFVWCNRGLHAGVVIFIVLSGFCIHLPLAKKANYNIDLKRYFKRRFFRIYPVMVCAMMLGLLATMLTSSAKGQVVANLVVNLALLPGILPIQGPMGNEILQTVSAEVWLYLFYPIGIYIIRNRGWLSLFGIVVIVHLLALVSLLFANSELSVWLERSFYIMLVYWWIGAFAAEVVFRKPRTSVNAASIIGLYCFYVALSHSLRFNGSHYFKSLVLAMVGAGFLAYVVRRELRSQYVLTETRILKIGVQLGEASYSLYAVHWPILTIIGFWTSSLIYTTNEWDYGRYAISCILVFLTAWLFYLFIEKPSHGLAMRLSSVQRA